MSADRNDELRALLLREQKRHVLADSCCAHDRVVHAELCCTLFPRRYAVEICVDENLCAAPQWFVGYGVDVAQDYVRLVAGLEERVGATVREPRRVVSLT